MLELIKYRTIEQDYYNSRVSEFDAMANLIPPVGGIRAHNLDYLAAEWDNESKRRINWLVSILDEHRNLANSLLYRFHSERSKFKPIELMELYIENEWSIHTSDFLMTLQSMCQLQLISYLKKSGWFVSDYGYLVMKWMYSNNTGHGAFKDHMHYNNAYRTHRNDAIDNFKPKTEGANILINQQLLSRTFGLNLQKTYFNNEIELFVKALSLRLIEYGEGVWRITPYGLLLTMEGRITDITTS